MQNNYPSGAMYDPSAPYAQPMADEDALCECEHPEGDECDGFAQHYCECGTPCCDAAMVDDSFCIECAAKHYMV